MRNLYGIKADFKQNKAIAVCFKYLKEILDDASKRFNLNMDYNPPSIRVFELKELVDKESGETNGFCIADKYKIIKDEKDYEPGAIFIKNTPDDINIIDKWQDLRFEKNHSSSSQFLSLFMHEWFHSIHIDKIFKKFGYAGMSEYAKQIYPIPCHFDDFSGISHLDELAKPLKPEDERCASSIISNRGSKNYMELFAETMVKLFTGNINKDKMIIDKNPLSDKDKLPLFIRKFIEEELN